MGDGGGRLRVPWRSWREHQVGLGCLALTPAGRARPQVRWAPLHPPDTERSTAARRCFRSTIAGVKAQQSRQFRMSDGSVPSSWRRLGGSGGQHSELSSRSLPSRPRAALRDLALGYVMLAKGEASFADSRDPCHTHDASEAQRRALQNKAINYSGSDGRSFRCLRPSAFGPPSRW